MKNDILNCCSYPTKVILVDDNQSFLNEIQLALSLHNVPSLSFLEVNKFFAYMQQYSTKTLADYCMEVSDDADMDHRIIDINIGNIYRKIYDSLRFDEITVIITDYAMPEMDGIVLLRKLDLKYSIKNILLTGVADEKIAVNAFNEGLIHSFIRKDAPNFVENLVNKILDLQLLYFKDVSKNIKGTVECFFDPAYVEFIKNTIRAEKTVEYYLIDEFGSFLLVDIHGNSKWLIVRDEHEMQHHYEIAKEYFVDGNVPDDILEKLAKRNSVLFLGLGDKQNLPPSEWESRLYPANTFVGKRKYYYSIITESLPEKELIKSFGDYLG